MGTDRLTFFFQGMSGLNALNIFSFPIEVQITVFCPKDLKKTYLHFHQRIFGRSFIHL